MSEFEKFVAKSLYTAEQIEIQSQQYLDAEKFIGKANYVGLQVAEYTQRLADSEKFIAKSKFVGQQIAITSYDLVDPKQPSLLILLIPLASVVIIRAENQNLIFYHIQKIISFIFVMILFSSRPISGAVTAAL